MNAIPFDTLKFARALQARGAFTDDQSSFLVDALGEILASDLAGKGDIRDLASQARGTEARLEGSMRETETKLEGSIRGTESKLESSIRETTIRMETRIREAQLRLETKIAEAKAETIKWFFGVVGVQTLAIIGSLVAVVRGLSRV